MKIKEIQNKEKWNDFIKKNQGSFLQSWEWGQFQYVYGRDIKYLAVEEEGIIIAGGLFIKYSLPAWRFYYFTPYGPIKYHELLLNYVRDKAYKEKIIFWRYENAKIADGLKAKDIHPRRSLLLEIGDKTQAELLQEMKPKTRYNIHLAEKKGVKIKVSTDISDLDHFYQLSQQTASRQKISIHPESYYQTMFHSLVDAGLLKLYLAEFQGKIIAANVIIFFHDTVTYLHGGTDHQCREVMAPHLLQWQAILDAKIAGYKYYDFFGIAETDDPEHPWAGITRFKKGFGGFIKEYNGAYEIPLNNLWYNAYRTVKKIKP
jgi:lipid II:glycine glycyltransferase (peptidoglycan interpeptide bridge formation enzyme)